MINLSLGESCLKTVLSFQGRGVMKKFFIHRILNMIPILLGVIVIVFFLLRLSDGDPAYIKLSGMGMPVTEELLQETRKAMGLNLPIYEQFWNSFRGMLQGDLGTSYRTNIPVTEELGRALLPTLELACVSFGLTVMVSLPLGIITALYANRMLDYIIRVLSFVAAAVPVFVLGLVLIYIFSLQLHWLPISGSGSTKNMILPVLSLSLALIGRYTKQIRAAVLEEINKQYVSAARIRGLPERIVLVSHVLRNSMIAVVTMLGFSFGILLGGTAVIEIMFVWPGLGKLAVEAVRHRDFPIIQGFTLLMASIYCMINLAVDLSYGYLDPRIRNEG